MAGNEGSRFAYVQVADSLLGYIAANGLAEGDRLPSIRKLSEQFSVSPVTAQRALAHLERSGHVVARSTRGYSVGAVPAEHLGAGGSETSEVAALRAEVRSLAERIDVLERLVSSTEPTISSGR